MAETRDPKNRGIRHGYDMVALRWEFIARRMSGEQLSLGEFHDEVAARRRAEGKSTMSRFTWEKRVRGWTADAEALLDKSNEAAAEQMVVDHMQQRREILTLAPRLREVLGKVLKLYEADLAAQLELPAEQRRQPDLADVKVLAELELQVRKVGSGLPQVHEVVGTVRNSEDSRPDARALADKGRSLRKHLEERGVTLPEPDAVH